MAEELLIFRQPDILCRIGYDLLLAVLVNLDDLRRSRRGAIQDTHELSTVDGREELCFPKHKAIASKFLSDGRTKGKGRRR